jgi:tRNA (guanine10-N2)-dimethyltransferase
MRLLFELSGEHPVLPAAEAYAIALSISPNSKQIASEPGVSVIDVPSLKSLSSAKDYPFDRTAYSHTGHRHLFSCPPSDIEKELKKTEERGEFPEKGSVRIRVKECGEKKGRSIKLALEKELGGVLFPKHAIDLVKPDISIRILVSQNAHCGIVLHEQEKRPLGERKPAKRPFFSPISLAPKLARAMVNLAIVKEGSKVLDPFCGTGGILLEAGLMGMRLVGSDLEWNMVEGCQRNLEHFGLKDFKVIRADIGSVVASLDSVDFDAVVTDVPYGRASGTRGEKVALIYERMFRTASLVLAPGKRLVLAIHDPALLRCGPDFRELQRIGVRVHRSLTRYLIVFERNA